MLTEISPAVIEGYLRVLALNPSVGPANVAEETFGYADVLRGQSVQRALQASSARSAIGNPELAKLVRVAQDGEKRIGAAVATLNNLLGLPLCQLFEHLSDSVPRSGRPAGFPGRRELLPREAPAEVLAHQDLERTISVISAGANRRIGGPQKPEPRLT
jgi:hypothetical protein